MSHKPPKNDVERLENIIEGLMDVDEDELPTLEETHAAAKAAGIDFEAWGNEIRKKALERLAFEHALRIAEASAARSDDLARIARRERPTGTHDQKVAMLRALVKRAEGQRLSAHFQKFEEATDAELDALIVSLEDLLEQNGKGKQGA